jgi:hypothetical protein
VVLAATELANNLVGFPVIGASFGRLSGYDGVYIRQGG